MSWLTLLALAGGTYLLKAVGPVGTADRELPQLAARLVELLPAALLAALVATQTFGAGTELTFDARAAGLGAAGIAVWRRAPFVVVILVGAGTTALLRALFG